MVADHQAAAASAEDLVVALAEGRQAVAAFPVAVVHRAAAVHRVAGRGMNG